MFKNYLTIAFRNVVNHRLHALITILGLAIGLTCATLTVLFARHEMGYDRFHERTERIYRVIRAVRSDDGAVSYHPVTAGPLAGALRRDFPEVKQAAHTWSWAVWIQRKGEWFKESVNFVDEDFLNAIPFPLVWGDRHQALKAPFSIVMTEKMARRYFGDDNPLGKVISIDRESLTGDYRVTGVVRLPRQSSLRFDFLISTASHQIQHVLDQWKERAFFETYIELNQGVAPEELEQKLSDWVRRYRSEDWRKQNVYHLQPLRRIHLYSNTDFPRLEPWRGDNIGALYLVSLTGLLILTIACINFVNLATARSTNRSLEVGIRKAVGADRYQLIRQFLGESVMLAILSLVLSVGLTEILLPAFRSLSSKQLIFLQMLDLPLILSLLGIALVVGVLSGLYPAFFLSAFQPVSVLKDRAQVSTKGQMFRQGLVVFQFSLSILLMIATIVVYRQLDFVSGKVLGFEREGIVMLPIFRADRTLQKPADRRLTLQYEQVKETFLSYPQVLQATASGGRGPMGGGQRQRGRAEGLSEDWKMRFQEVDADFISTCGITLVAGRNFLSGLESNPQPEFILNETAVRQLGWMDPIGKKLEMMPSRRMGTVIGVVADFHYDSLYETIEPIVLCVQPSSFLYLSLKVRSENIGATLDFFEQTWKRFVPTRPFQYYFLDEWLMRMYGEELRLGRTVGTASVLAIFVACLGLLGLSSFMAERRTKEIGIRKVLGASVWDISLMLSKAFLQWVVLANAIAWPVAYFAMSSWLEHFAYRTDLSLWIFLLSGAVVLLIAIVTVGYQAIRAGRENPVVALRYE